MDILDVLGYYGCLADCGDYDTNGDGVVGAPDLLFILGYYGQICPNDLDASPQEHFGLVLKERRAFPTGFAPPIFGQFGPDGITPTLEPTLRADRIVDAALVAVVLALFVASAFGLTELPGGVVEWDPSNGKGSTMRPKA